MAATRYREVVLTSCQSLPVTHINRMKERGYSELGLDEFIRLGLNRFKAETQSHSDEKLLFNLRGQLPVDVEW